MDTRSIPVSPCVRYGHALAPQLLTFYVPISILSILPSAGGRINAKLAPSSLAIVNDANELATFHLSADVHPAER
jgi:hypothetical protein